MRIPQSPPTVNFLEDTDLRDEFLGALANPAMAQFTSTVNHRYLHWEKMRYYPRPDGISAKTAWMCVQMSRMPHMRNLDISFEEGELKFWMPPRHMQWLHIIDKHAGGEIGGRTSLVTGADKERYLVSSLMEEAIASSQLEGAATTRADAKRMLRTQRKPRNKAEQMILNNYHAILEIRELKNEKLSPEMICHIQEVITKDTLELPDAAGRFRTPDDPPVVIADNVSDDVIFTPPIPQVIPNRIEEICEFANDKPDDFIHPVIEAISLHFAMGYVHPFLDGNGRTARALFYWYMLKRGYWLFEYLPISRIFVNAPIQYAKSYLYTETDDGDLTYFINYHLAVIARALRELHSYLEQQQLEVSQASEILQSWPDLNHRQIDLIYDAIKHPRRAYEIKQHSGIHNVTNATSRSDLLGLEEKGLLTKRKSGKKWLFLAVDRLIKKLARDD